MPMRSLFFFFKSIAHDVTLETLIFFQTSLFKIDIGNNDKDCWVFVFFFFFC